MLLIVICRGILSDGLRRCGEVVCDYDGVDLRCDVCDVMTMFMIIEMLVC